MLKTERHQIILTQLKKKTVLSIEEAMELTGGSKSTVGRDLDELASLHRIERIRGGAAALRGGEDPETGKEASFATRQDMQLDEKERIASAAHDMIHENETILIGCGTTTCAFAKTLGDFSSLYVSTNDLMAATVLAEYRSVHLTVLGGELREAHYSLGGAFTEDMINCMHADKAFIGIDAVDVNVGYMNFSAAEMKVNKLMHKASRQSIVICDHTKFDKIAFVSFCRLNEVDLLITGRELDEKYKKALEERDVNFLLV